MLPAAKIKDVKTIRSLLSQGENVNAKINHHGDTLLHWTVRSDGNEEIVKILIDFGADVNLRNEKSETALEVALNQRLSRVKKINYIKILIYAGADVNTSGQLNCITALHVAVSTWDWDLDFFQFLISRGADVNAKDHLNRSALHCAASHIVSEDPTFFKVLLSANADVHAKNSRGETAIHLLSKSDEEYNLDSLCKVIEIFKEYGADFNEVDVGTGDTPFDLAVKDWNYQVVKAFILCNIRDVNYLTPYGTALHRACQNNDIESVWFLMDNGANVNALNLNNETPLQCFLNKKIDGEVCYQGGMREEVVEMQLFTYLFKFNPDLNTENNEGHNILIPIRSSNVCINHYLFWQPILRRLAKFCPIKNPLISSLLNTISSNPEQKIYFEKCNQELKIAKNSEVHPDSWITFWNLLTDDETKLLRYAGNTNLSESFEKKNIVERFPIYGTLIYERFATAIKTRSMKDQAIKILCDLLPIKNLDQAYLIIEKILEYMDFENLRILLHT